MILNKNILLNTTRLKVITCRNYSTKYRSSKVIRQQFLDYFVKDNDHNFVRSSSVIPFCDPTLSFTNAGMNQFKNIFLGNQQPKYTRVANTQKCIRVGGKHNDLSVVGTDGYHHTFFEMLGNWSFGDYFKKEACEMAWNLLTKVYEIPPERLYVTYFKGDQTLGLKPDIECRDIWLEIGVPINRIVACDAKDNFWEMGKTGPCGGCTEIHVDHLPSYRKVNRAKDVNKDKHDLTELWNIVFIENFRKSDGTIEHLQQKHVDTGMGFERLVAFLQDKRSNYDTDLFIPLFEKIQRITRKPPYLGSFSGDDFKRDMSYRVIADHSRMIAIALADGMFPEENKKLRRILRKCLNVSVKVFSHENLLTETIPVVANILGDTFPELHQKLFTSLDIVKYEDEYYKSLKSSLSKGIKDILEKNPQLMDLDLYEYPGFVQAYNEFKRYKKSNPYEISGDMMIQLYSNFGLDLDFIERLAEIERMTLDINGFENRMEAMKGKSLENFKVDNDIVMRLDGSIPATNNDSKYNYEYDPSSNLYKIKPVKTKILAIFDTNGQSLKSTNESTTSYVKIVTKDSPIYVESGGQESDVGYLEQNGTIFNIESVSSKQNIIFHKIKTNQSANLNVGDEVELSIDNEKRTSCIRNHTATHILNAAIRNIKNLPTYQKSSTVTSENLKIELAMIGPKLNESEIDEIEKLVRRHIKELPLQQTTEVINSQELQSKNNVIMVPGEVYPDEDIHVVSFDDFSHELCCGTHANSTSEILDFTFLSVKSTGRVSYLFNAVTGNKAIEAIKKGDELISQIKSLSENDEIEKFTVILSHLRKIASKLHDNEISYLKKIQCQKLITDMKETIKYKSRDVVSELLDIEMKSVIEQNEPFIVHFLACSDLMQSVSLLKATRLVSDDKPVIIISLVDNEVKARCCVPKEMINENFNAEKWLTHFAKIFNSTVKPPKGQDPLEVCLMKGKKVKSEEFNTMLEQAIAAAKSFANSNILDETRFVKKN
ncbi:hypothetical protein PVAND_006509 [Polypedilum vanderplanki]|uniref:Alanine--tRNA ligase n=1 Tax=Polypedilum vanderplanki TaxID=319348 RepID=A0A9J6C456_POLVA|nr:hypothetical protein PVAND_006509 [Polypedilum vanderplanki]